MSGAIRYTASATCLLCGWGVRRVMVDAADAVIGKRMVGKAGKGRASHEAQPKQRGDPERKTAARLAAEVGVSRATMERAAQLERAAPDKAEAREVVEHRRTAHASPRNLVGWISRPAPGSRAPGEDERTDVRAAESA